MGTVIVVVATLFGVMFAYVLIDFLVAGAEFFRTITSDIRLLPAEKPGEPEEVVE